VAQTFTTRRYISVDDAAEILGVVPKTIRRYVARGKIRGYRVADEKLLRVASDDVYDLLTPIPTAGGHHDDAA
jgi:excisionase family DNA binding protein